MNCYNIFFYLYYIIPLTGELNNLEKVAEGNIEEKVGLFFCILLIEAAEYKPLSVEELISIRRLNLLSLLQWIILFI